MKPARTDLFRNVLLFLIAASLAACAKPYHLNILYTTPEEPTALPQAAVALKIVDARESREIFSAKARREFDKWDGSFALVDKTPPSAEKVETTDLTGVLRQAMEKRLSAMSVQVVNDAEGSAPVMELRLKSFLVDLKDRTWVSDFGYEVELSKDGSKTGREQIRAQAERTKVMGKGGGQKLINDIFAEGVNRLNLKKLFENAGF